jgi:ABC-type nickel/cobalt efflux system permease component RcnA
MSVRGKRFMARARTVLLLAGAGGAFCLVAAAISDGALHAALAQTPPPRNPFDMGLREGGGPPASGFAAWVLSEQMRFERMLSGAVRALRTDIAALWTLLGISFAYGVFHAAGPGHGKAVVASYMFANERSLKRGLAISFLAAGLQAVVAISIVAVLALALNATAARMKEVANLVELASYAGVALLGLWLTWRKGRALAAQLRPPRKAQDHQQDHAQDHAHHNHAHHDHAHHDHAHAHKPHDHAHHVHDEHCGHFHAPAAETLGDGFTWRGALATIFAAGARPCSGAILVLVFALAQGVFFAGVAAAFAMALGTALTTGALAVVAVAAKGIAVRFLGEGGGRGAIVVRVLEVAAAAFVLFLGASLLLGALAG